MRFDPASGKLVCDYCGAVIDIAQDEKPEAAPAVEEQDLTVGGLDFDAITSHASDPGAAALPIYNCVSCGAEVIAPAEQMALTCPYCGNNIVLTDKASGSLRPDAVIPFEIDKKALPDAMNAFYKGKVLLPKNFFSESTMSKVTGVYVPFWVFNGRMSGNLTFRAESSTTTRSGDYKITETRDYVLDRDVNVEFRDVPVDASGRIDDALMDSLEPFNMESARPFDMRYLAGFTADRFDVAKADTEPRARQRMANTAEKVVSSRIGGYDRVTHTGGELTADLNARYMLFPVYMFTLAHGGRDYQFAVNGQTGKVVGDVPIDKKVSLGYFLKRAGIIAGAIILFSVLKYFLGW